MSKQQPHDEMLARLRERASIPDEDSIVRYRKVRQERANRDDQGVPEGPGIPARLPVEVTAAAREFLSGRDGTIQLPEGLADGAVVRMRELISTRDGRRRRASTRTVGRVRTESPGTGPHAVGFGVVIDEVGGELVVVYHPPPYARAMQPSPIFERPVRPRERGE